MSSDRVSHHRMSHDWIDNDLLRSHQHGFLQGLKRFAGRIQKGFDFLAQIRVAGAVGFEECGSGFRRQIESLIE